MNGITPVHVLDAIIEALGLKYASKAVWYLQAVAYTRDSRPGEWVHSAEWRAAWERVYDTKRASI